MELVSRCCGICFANQLHIHHGIGFTVLWNWLVKPIPWCRGIGSLFLSTSSLSSTTSSSSWTWAKHQIWKQNIISLVCYIMKNCIIDKWPSSSAVVAAVAVAVIIIIIVSIIVIIIIIIRSSCASRASATSTQTRSSRPLSAHGAMLQVSTRPQGWKSGACNYF